MSLRQVVVTVLAITLVLASPSEAQQPTVAEILKKLEGNYKQRSDVRAKVLLTQQKAGQGIKATEMMYYRRDADNSFLIVLTAPESEKGNGYLRIDDNFWMYRRNTRTFQHVNRDESIAGTDARGDDFETRNLTELYEGVKDGDGKDIIASDKLGQMECWKFEVKAKVNDVDYPKKNYWVSKDKLLELKEEAFSSNGTHMQTAYFQKYTIVNEAYVPVKQLFIDEFEKGNRTAVEISGISTEKLDNAIFTKAYLENLSK